ncbi:MAG: cytochrome c biogenesis protein DipZ [Candidatus Omnitrophica bacterium]|nr:cytochrome c biogenesis protein DipZ [Candidatus Omnitrophota bacterium]
MFVLGLFSFLAGVVTILSPCIIPVLPIILAGSAGRGRVKPWGVVTGFVTSFTFFTLTLSMIVKLTGLPADTMRVLAIVLLAVFGLFLCIPSLQVVYENVISRFWPKQGVANKGQGFWSGFLLGVSLGLIWTPCVGPIMAAVITLAAASAVSAAAVFITLAYALGTAVPMLVIMFGGRKLLDRIPWIKANAGIVQRSFGVVMVVMAVVLFKGYDRRLESWVVARFPTYGSGLTALENNEHVKHALDNLTGDERLDGQDASESVAIPLAPEIVTGGQWFNSPPLNLQALRGKVVVIDFWTYTCINCIRTLPELKAWHDRYAGLGLVIIGVHTPEFEFEKDPGNVAKAVRDFGLKYPVVQDNNYATWKAYRNQYWPAKYFIDRTGRIRSTHFGEGGEAESEAVIRKLLQEAGSRPGAYAGEHPYFVEAGTPETYLGLERTERFGSVEGLREGTGTYSMPSELKLNNYAYAGQWSVAKDHSSPISGARLDLHFLAKDVFLVMRAQGKDAVRVEVLLDGKPVGTTEHGQDVNEGAVIVRDDRLYHLLSIRTAGEHTLTLKFLDSHAELFAFTFG